jgi:hypothetical protein
MPSKKSLIVRIKKAKDGRTALSCIRADGTTTWQRQQGGQAAFFPTHDLTHLAVETTLCLVEGFYGLVASGWDLGDFGSPWPRGPLPSQANISELIVAAFDLERNTGGRATAREINDRVGEYCRENSLPDFRQIADEEVVKVREKRAELFAKWEAVNPGDSLEIPFVVARQADHDSDSAAPSAP